MRTDVYMEGQDLSAKQLIRLLKEDSLTTRKRIFQATNISNPFPGGATKFRVVHRQTHREKRERAKTVSFGEGETKRVDPRENVQNPQKTCTYMKRNVKKLIGLIGLHKRGDDGCGQRSVSALAGAAHKTPTNTILQTNSL